MRREKRGRPVEIVRVLEPAPTAPAEARSSLVPLSRTVSPDQLDDLRLVVSELVTNSVVHAGLTDQDAIILSVEVLPSSVRVEVVDGGHGFAGSSGRPPSSLGWGLPIVDRLADRWGTERTSQTKVWAEFTLRPGPRIGPSNRMDRLESGPH
jgi:anti-sigma regulatory factor (Ser/Thr protein kinase)